MDIRETISKVPTWGWIAGGGLVLGLFFLLNRGSSATTMSSTGGLAPDANSILQQLQDAAGGGGGGGGTSPNPTPTPIQTLIGYKAVVHSSTGVQLYSSANGPKVNQKLWNITVTTGLRKKVNGQWWYQITGSSNKALIGKWFKPQSGITWTQIFQSVQKPTTTTSTTVVNYSSNNAVA